MKIYQKILKKISSEKLSDLLKRAAINIYDFNTSVNLSIDDTFRIAVKTGHGEFGDCVEIQIMHEKNPGPWYCANFSPARAKIIALQILARVEHLEKNDPGMKCIDRVNEFKDGNLVLVKSND
jgi:hypothetical protein